MLADQRCAPGRRSSLVIDVAVVVTFGVLCGTLLVSYVHEIFSYGVHSLPMNDSLRKTASRSFNILIASGFATSTNSLSSLVYPAFLEDLLPASPKQQPTEHFELVNLLFVLIYHLPTIYKPPSSYHSPQLTFLRQLNDRSQVYGELTTAAALFTSL